ncbi:hypothetical protein GOODEAATRI_027349 [Goodea atripinnis]|uniref:Uncharacterized protein n=1 Tax=Goodea atripinnis TaxID=208336 RepID=A0ABV0PHT2_9TELE
MNLRLSLEKQSDCFEAFAVIENIVATPPFISEQFVLFITQSGSSGLSLSNWEIGSDIMMFSAVILESAVLSSYQKRCGLQMSFCLSFFQNNICSVVRRKATVVVSPKWRSMLIFLQQNVC